MAHGHDPEHPRHHMQQHVTVECPVAELIGSQIERDLAAGQDVDRVFQRMMARTASNQFEEVSVQVNRMGHHGVVNEIDAHPLHVAERDWLSIFAELLAVEGPHVALHVGGQVQIDLARRRALVWIGRERFEVAVGQHPVPDLLDLLLAGEDPKTARKMTTAELRDNLLTFIVAGHETTALTLSWALYLCAFDQGVQDAARAQAKTVLGDRAASAADIARLPLIRQIVDETLRMYPPAAFLSRTAQAADTLCGREIRPGDTVILPIYALHRHHLLWPDPDRFDPARFADPKAIERFAYLPFGDGPRVCIGANFALQEAVIILATLLARFRFSAIAGRAPKPVMILTLRPEGGVWLGVEAA